MNNVNSGHKQQSKSVSRLVLKSILSIYFIVLLFVTLFHLSYEYLHTENNVQRELRDVEGIFNESLTAALWAEDKNQLNAIAAGMVNLGVVTGVKIENKSSAIAIEQFQEPASAFSHSYDLNYAFRDKNLYLGSVTLYSGKSVIIERIKVSFYLLLLSAIIKSFFLTLLFFFSVKKFLHKPLQNLIDQIEQIKVDQVQQSDILEPVNTSTEVNELTSAFNQLKHSLANKLLQIEESKNHFESIFQNSKVGMFQANLKGELITVNRYIVELYQYPSEEELLASHKTLSSLLSMQQQDFKVALSSLAGGESLCFETEVSNAVGDALACEFTANVIFSDSGDVRFIEGILLDLSDKKAREIALREKYIAENSNLSKSMFLAAASHDLRQPVHAMSMLIELLASVPLSAQANVIVDKLGHSVDGLRSLFDSLLDISSLDAGVVEVNPVPCSVRHSLDQVVELYKLQASDKGLVLEACGEDIWLQTDPVLLQRILSNLVSNAIIHTDKGAISLRVLSSDDNIYIEVRDSGKGIAIADQDKIFDEFQQLHNPERDRRKGLGLGLAICKRLAKLLNCQLRLSSTINQGACFSLVFPRALQAPKLSQVLDNNTAGLKLDDLSGFKILLIDDETDILEVFADLLSSWHVTKVVAVTDEEAACDAIIEGFKPDIIVSDYRLRDEKTGLQAIEMLSDMLGYAIPAIVITGDTSPQSLAEFERSGHKVLFKPVPPEKLKRELLLQLSEHG